MHIFHLKPSSSLLLICVCTFIRHPFVKFAALCSTLARAPTERDQNHFCSLQSRDVKICKHLTMFFIPWTSWSLLDYRSMVKIDDTLNCKLVLHRQAYNSKYPPLQSLCIGTIN